MISSRFHLRSENVFFSCLVSLFVLWSSPVLCSEAFLTRTPFGMEYFLFTPVVASFNFFPPSRDFTTFASSFVKGKIHCNSTNRATCPSALCNRDILSSANFNDLVFWLTRDPPFIPICRHVTKQQYGDCEPNRISHCSEKRKKEVN